MTDAAPPELLRRAFDRLVIVGFLLGIALPLILGVRRFDPPDWVPLDTFTARFNREAEQSFGFRDRLIHAHNWISCFLLRTSPTPSVVVGKNDWLFYHGDSIIEDASPLNDYRGVDPLPLGHLEHLRWGYQDQYDWLRRHGIDYLLVFIPSKPFLYPEHLPDGFRRGPGPSWREQVVAYLRKHTDVPVLDLTPRLMEARKKGRVFDPTDSHWNWSGMFAGYTAIIEACQAYIPGLIPLSEDQFVKTPTTRPGGDLAGMLKLARYYPFETKTWQANYTKRARLKPVSDDDHAAQIGGTGDPAQPTAVIYRDSFSDQLLPLLAEHFREVEFVWWRAGGAWRRTDGWQMAGIEDKRPDLVLHILADRILERPIPYAERIHRQFTQERFEDATRMLAHGAPESGWDAFAPGWHAEFQTYDDALIVHADRPGARIRLPPLPDTDRLLPILRVEIRPPGYSSLRLLEPAPPERFWRRRGERIRWRAPLEQGTNVFYIPIIDPEVRQPLYLELGGRTGAYLIYRMEIRGAPRYPDSQGSGRAMKKAARLDR